MTSYLPRTMATQMGYLTSTLAGGTLDLLDVPKMDQQTIAPPAFQPFRFEPRRARIDWRLLHGVDINNIVRDVDLDTLEKIVSIVAFGDIEAEDTRHLSELNFVKVFRLSQLIIEYLLYVQDCLQSTNSWLQQDRATLEKYIAAARLRLRELDAHYRMSKRELRRARKTAKTYEVMVALGKLPAQQQGTGAQGAQQAAQPEQDTKRPPQATADAQQQPAQAAAVATAMEALLKRELGLLSERLTRAQVESQQLRAERDEMLAQIKEIDSALRIKGGAPGGKLAVDMSELRSAKEQLSRANADYKMLKAEKDELSSELDKAQAARKVLQEEKDKLLQELANHDVGAKSAPAAPGAPADTSPSSPLGAMLLAAEARNKDQAALVEQLQGQVNALQKQLMKAMKEAAKPPTTSGPSPEELAKNLAASEAAQKELQAKVEKLEAELVDKRRQHNEDVAGLQEELVSYQEQVTSLRHELLALKAGPNGVPPAVSMTVKPKAGFVPDDGDNNKGTTTAQAPTQGDTTKLSAQVSSLTQENTALEAQVTELRSRCARLDELIKSKDSQLEEAWRLIKDLGSQLALPAANRDPEAVGRVKAQVEEFERVAEMAGAKPPASSAAPAPQQQPSPAPTSPPKLGAGDGSSHNASFKFMARPLMPRGLESADSVHSSVGTPGTPVLSGGKSSLSDASRIVAAARAAAASAPLPHTPNRPTVEQMSAIKAALMQRVTGQPPEALAALIEDELRVLTENPYEYEEDDEDQFRRSLPHEVPGSLHGGVLTVQEHTAQDLPRAQQRHGPALLAHLDDIVATYGVDPATGVLSDREYAALMLERRERWDSVLGRLPGGPEARDRAEFLRDAMLTHLELVKRRVTNQSGKEALMTDDPTATYAELASAAAAGLTPSKAQLAFAAASQQIAEEAGGREITAGQLSSPTRLSAAIPAPAARGMASAFTAAAGQATGAAPGDAYTQQGSAGGAMQSTITIANSVPLGAAPQAPAASAQMQRAGSMQRQQGRPSVDIPVVREEEEEGDEDDHVAHLQSLLPPAGHRGLSAPAQRPTASHQPGNESDLSRASSHTGAVTAVQPGELTHPGQGPVGGWASSGPGMARSASGRQQGGSGGGALGASGGYRAPSPVESASVSPLNQSMQSNTSALNQSPTRRSAAASAAANIIGGIGTQPPPPAAFVRQGSHNSMNQSIRSARTADTTGPQGGGGGANSLNQTQGSTHVQAFNASLPRGGAASLNQSLREHIQQQQQQQQRAASGAMSAANASIKSSKPPLPAGIAPLNMSIQSQGKASLRDYSAVDFDDDDDEGDTDMGSLPVTDEYAMGADEGEELDEGLPGDALPEPGFGRAASASRNSASQKGLDRPSAPSRLARVTSADDEAEAARAREGSGRQGGVSGQEPAGPRVLRPSPSGGWLEGPGGWGGGVSRVGAAYSLQELVTRADTPQAAVAGLPATATSTAGRGGGDEYRDEDFDGADIDMGSIHSFHPNDTVASTATRESGAHAAQAAAIAARIGAGAWGSPSNTIKAQQQAAASAARTAAGSGAGASSPLSGTGRWNETIQTVGSTVGDEIQAFNETQSTVARGPSVRPAGGAQQVLSGVPPGVGRRLTRRDSYDTVSEVEYA